MSVPSKIDEPMAVLGMLVEKTDNIEEDIKQMKADIRALNDVAGQTKGGLFVVLLLGSFLGGISALGSAVWKFFHG